MDKLEKAGIRLPKLEFKKECPKCHQMWLTFPSNVCPDCEKGIKPPIIKAEVKKVVIDPVVGENDAIEEWWQK
jgi:hypothetical protein